ncbi:hypothetical protein AJ80_04316 [Polytolypa hystricis UAMH7299]|uniref:Glutamate decarboxylase n=1 Tax=Polytolypa hystricis (strain UAMH7299) TaxID=1447883 RepID=A0A2B7YDB3_POLH7|nr:hypothetical protein AJ80_04316 [Polytolypa hystricis UAMH7299]
MSTNGHNQSGDRAAEVRNLLNAVQDRLVQFIRAADEDNYETTGGDAKDKGPHTALVEYQTPQDLQAVLNLDIPDAGQGQDGLLKILDQVLRYSVNTWHQGFLDKLYASTNAPGVAAELILAALNTNVHVYQVSPALSVIEKYTAKRLAALFGLNGPHAGGISVQGGSASNTTSIVIARNNLFPETKADGYGDRKFVLFTSAHGHYSIEKAAQMLGFGSNAVWSVPVDAQGRLIPSSLEELIEKAKSEGKTPFYVNATAGTTVLGSFDPFAEIAAICQKYKLWFHIDGSWGGAFAFSSRQRTKLSGSHLADSIAINPHKMLGTPVTCSFLLGADVRQFHRANTLPAGYLFHNGDDPETIVNGQDTTRSSLEPESPEVWDLADLTLQCGRRADSLKLFLGWTYYGSHGYQRQINSACGVAAYLATLIENSPNLVLLSQNPPPCLQVCFYYAPNKQFIYPPGKEIDGHALSESERGKRNSKITEEVTRGLVPRGFMVDFAPPSADDDEAAVVGNGKFFRCVVNVLTKKETADALVKAAMEVGEQVVKSQRGGVVNLPAPKEVRAPSGFGRNPAEKGHGPVVH